MRVIKIGTSQRKLGSSSEFGMDHGTGGCSITPPDRVISTVNRTCKIMESCGASPKTTLLVFATSFDWASRVL
jgi:hypothetical protein